MGLWSVVIPSAGTNEITDPSFEAATLTTCWTNSSLTTFEKSTTRAVFGANSLHCISDNTGDYCYSNAVANADATETWTASCWVYIVSGDFELTIQENNAGYTDLTSTTLSTTGAWTRVSVTGTLSASVTDARIKLGPNSTAASEFYVDGVQFEQASTASTFIDGTQPGCSWNGTAHASSSTRSAQSRAGGVVTDLDTYGAYSLCMGGWGTLPVGLNVSEQAFRAGALLQSIKQKTRTMTITFDVEGTSLANYHSKRKDLIDAFKPDLVADVDNKPEPIRLQYTGTGTTVEIAVDYAGGLEGDLAGGFREVIPVRFQASDDPFWHEIPESAAVLTETLNVANADEVIKKVDGIWSNVSTDFAGQVNAIAYHPDGSIYIGGAFTNVGDANGDYIVKYNPTTGALTSLGTGMNDIVACIGIDASGNVYVGGAFTLAGGVADTARIAKWDGSVWTPLSTGLSAPVYALAFRQDGYLVVGGGFTNAGDANGDYIVLWSGSAWSSLGTGLNGTCNALAVDASSNIYAAGSFTSAGGTSVTGIAKWNGSAWSIMGASGLSGGGPAGYALAMMADGTLVLAGDFTSVNGISANRIAKWNGAVWSPLGSGVNAAAYALAIDANNQIIIGGIFTTAGGLALADRIAVWNGSAWSHLDVDLPGNPTILAIVTRGTSLYLGYDTTGTAVTSKLNTITNNSTTKTYPKLTLKRSGGTTARLEWLKNETTGAICWFNYSLLSGETLTIDFSTKTIMSDFFGNVIGRALLPNSDFGAWCLFPGSNSVSLYVYETGTPTVTSTMLWRDTHHSVDGSAA